MIMPHLGPVVGEPIHACHAHLGKMNPCRGKSGCSLTVPALARRIPDMTWLTAFEFPADFDDLRGGGTQADAFARELQCELAPQHELSRENWSVIGRALPQDEVVLALDNDRVALVHLTWKGGAEPTPYPLTIFVSSQGEFETLIRERYERECSLPLH